MPVIRRFARLPVRELPGGLMLIEAATVRSRLRGVGGLDALPADQGLELRTSAIHTWTVRFPLDLIWRARDGTVLRIDQAVPRWQIRGCRHAYSVIEVAAGAGETFLAALTASS